MNQQSSLVKLINARLDTGAVELPVIDDIALRIHRGVGADELDADGIARILEEDPVLVTEVLRMANSSFFAGLEEVRSLRDATVRMGLKQVASIVMSVSQKRLYSASRGPFRVRMQELHQHVTACSVAARWIVRRAAQAPLAEEAFVAGMLHDVGKLSLLRIIEDLQRKMTAPLSDELIDATIDELYCEHGAAVLALWNLPELYQSVIRSQADEQPDETNVVLMAVRLADKACAVKGLSDRPDATMDLDNCIEAMALGLDENDIAELLASLDEMTSGLDAAA
ncbi:MAG: hypothetical protein CSB44_10270 [Gammaproteobacteria bacterium]|nr:MAG: hypothetical protein CSB44_10270 [Gammaproteobacteria bacterium]